MEEKLTEMLSRGELAIYQVTGDEKFDDIQMRILINKYFDLRHGYKIGVAHGIIIWKQFDGYRYYVGKYWLINGGLGPLSGAEWICYGSKPSIDLAVAAPTEEVELAAKLAEGISVPISFRDLSETLKASLPPEKRINWDH